MNTRSQDIKTAVQVIKSAILQSQMRAVKAINQEQLALYYGIGRYVSMNSRKGFWGKGAIKSISELLRRELPGLRGFSEASLKKMRSFYEEWQMIDGNSFVATNELETDVSKSLVPTNEIAHTKIEKTQFTLPEGFTIDTLMGSHESNPRNTLIARIFYLLGYIENWGRAYEKIVEGFTNAKLTVPTFEEVRGGLMATIKRERFMSRIEKPNNIRFIKDFIKERGLKLTERQQEILQLLRDNPELTSQKISQKISHNNAATPRTIIKDMNYLREIGLLQRVGSKKEGHWEIIAPEDVIEVFD